MKRGDLALGNLLRRLGNSLRGAALKKVQVDYWFQVLCLAGSGFVLLDYCRLGGDATETEQLVVFFRAVTFIALGALFLGLFCDIERAPVRSQVAGFIAGLGIALLWMNAQLYGVLNLHAHRALKVLYGGEISALKKSVALSGLSLSEIVSWSYVPALGALLGYMIPKATRLLSRSAPLQMRRLTMAWVCMLGLLLHLVAQDVEARTLRPRMQSIAAASVPFSFGITTRAPGVRKFEFRLPARRNYPDPQPASERAGRDNPNLIIIMVESLRADAVTPEIMPSLFAFGQDCIQVERAYSTGNATQLSWFSLLTGDSPLRFEQAQADKGEYGSWPVRALKTLGYSIDFSSSLNLDYFSLEPVAFGTRSELLDSRFDSRDFGGGEFLTEIDVAGRDVSITDRLIRLLNDAKTEGGRCFIVSYNSSHHPYFFPPNFSAPFPDYVDSWDYTRLSGDHATVARIRNKYHNSLAFLDREIARVINALKDLGAYDETVVVVLGDHGEEFLDEGSMFHNNALHEAQIRVPLLIKLRGASAHKVPIMSTMDVLPTVIDSLGAYPMIENRCDGVSVLCKKAPVAISAAANGARDPNEFILADLYGELHFRFVPSDSPCWSRTEVWLQDVAPESRHRRANHGDSNGLSARLNTYRTFAEIQ